MWGALWWSYSHLCWRKEDRGSTVNQELPCIAPEVQRNYPASAMFGAAVSNRRVTSSKQTWWSIRRNIWRFWMKLSHTGLRRTTITKPTASSRTLLLIVDRNQFKPFWRESQYLSQSCEIGEPEGLMTSRDVTLLGTRNVIFICSYLNLLLSPEAHQKTLFHIINESGYIQMSKEKDAVIFAAPS